MNGRDEKMNWVEDFFESETYDKEYMRVLQNTEGTKREAEFIAGALGLKLHSDMCSLPAASLDAETLTCGMFMSPSLYFGQSTSVASRVAS